MRWALPISTTVALGRGLYYETRAARPSAAMGAARRALLAALAAAGRSRR
jgi:hypothetical protein